jgi:hypothetical protein
MLNYAGSMPRRQQHIILGWAEVHQRELLANWTRARDGSPLAKIEGTLSREHCEPNSSYQSQQNSLLFSSILFNPLNPVNPENPVNPV